MFSSNTVIYIFELIGTIAFASSGALAGILADIGDHAVAVVQADLLGQLGDHGKGCPD